LKEAFVSDVQSERVTGNGIALTFCRVSKPGRPPGLEKIFLQLRC